MLAREIHDVAGEIDSVSPSSAPQASVRKQPDIYIITASMEQFIFLCLKSLTGYSVEINFL